MKRVQEMAAEEAKRRIPVAQGLPWTTDKPQVSSLHRSSLAILEEIYGDTLFDLQSLSKPPVKEQTKPINIKLHTEQRAARRAGYNYLVNPCPLHQEF